MQRYKLTVAYHGSAYQGWQIQPALTTSVAGCLVLAAGPLMPCLPIHLTGAGRTDAGVHGMFNTTNISTF